MTPQSGSDIVAELIASTRGRLRLRDVLQTTGWALSLACLAVVLLVTADWVTPFPVVVRRTLRWLPLALLFVSVLRLLRGWQRIDGHRVALFIDEQSGLGNVVSTHRTPNTRGPVAEAFHHRAGDELRALRPKSLVPLDLRVFWAGTIGAVVLVTLMAVGSGAPNGVVARWWTPSDDPALSAQPSSPIREDDSDAPPTLGSVRFVVRAPEYSGLPDQQGEIAGAIAALPGSVVELSGDGTALPPALSVTVVGGSSPTARPDRSGWHTEWRVGPDDRGLTLTVTTPAGVVEQRVIPLRLLRDRAPSVELTDPTADFVVASSTGRITVAAHASDDYGISDLTLHWVRSSGSGESFDFSEGEWSWDRSEPTPEGRRAELSLSLDDLGLGPGDVVHVRAMARDRNSVTGPGIGVSATRQIRVTREADLSDITTLVGSPIEREREPVLSQRMIILLTEELRDSAPTLSSAEFLEASQEIADEQARLRARIGEQIFSRATGAMQDPEAHLDFEEGETEVFLDELEGLVEQGPLIDPVTGIASVANVDIPAHEHDADPIVAINRSLLTVYNHMWDAERELQSAQVEPSLVPQYLALDELQRVRDSERIFARGRVRVAPIDVPAARGTGELDEAAPSARSPAPGNHGATREVLSGVDALLAEHEAALGRATGLEIAGLALDILEAAGDPAVAEALAQAATLAEAGDADGTRAGLVRARSLLNTSTTRVGRTAANAPTSITGARYAAIDSRASSGTESDPPTDAVGEEATSSTEPFVFATVRYESGDWDSAPLVPNNLIHSLAQYTDLAVVPEGVVVDLSSAEIFDHPFLYLTGHLPVFFNEAEGRNLVDFVDRGGFVFVDDHNHDIDGAFHRSVTSELQRLFGAERWSAVPNDHELYSSFFEFEDGPPITGHELSGWGDGLIHRELFGVTTAGRIGVLYSNKDYSSEWSYHADNKRFLAVDNTRFGVNIIVYALTR